MIDKYILDIISAHKSLLAFSYGIDSTALFYILDSLGVEFDIIFVNYNSRIQSIQEQIQAINLASKFNKKIFIKNVNLPHNISDYENRARIIRYDFFNQICSEYGYGNLILAHQLNDMFEWFLMRFSKGAGLANLLGMSKVKRVGDIKFIRPILDIPKFKLKEFLDNNGYKYFVDDSNFDTKFERNFIRSEFSDKFINHFYLGVQRSFKYLNRDLLSLMDEFLFCDNKICVIKRGKNSIDLIDKAVKKFGVLMSSNQRKQAYSDCVISSKITVCYGVDKIFIFNSVDCKNIVMDKRFKEFARTNSIPPKLRPFLYKNRNYLKIIFGFNDFL